MLFDDNKIKIAKKPGKRQKENPARCTGEGKRWKWNIREVSREGKTVCLDFEATLDFILLDLQTKIPQPFILDNELFSSLYFKYLENIHESQQLEIVKPQVLHKPNVLLFSKHYWYFPFIFKFLFLYFTISSKLNSMYWNIQYTDEPNKKIIVILIIYQNVKLNLLFLQIVKHRRWLRADTFHVFKLRWAKYFFFIVCGIVSICFNVFFLSLFSGLWPNSSWA